MALPKEFLEIEFEKAELVDASAVKPGEWYWMENNYGHPSPSVFQAGKTPSGPSTYHQVILHPKYHDKQHLGHATLPLQSLANPGPGSPYFCRLWRTRQQPKLTRDIFLGDLNAVAFGAPYPNTGTDPEIFVEDSKGNVIPAWEFLPSKTDKTFAPPGPNIFWDGFQAEFTVVAGSCMDGVGTRIRERLQQMPLPKGARFSARSVVEIPKSMMKSAKDEHVAFGCRPSLNAYGLEGERISDPRDIKIRFAGGHIHWGFDKGAYSEALIADAIKFVDLIAGLMSVSIAEGMDDPRRRRYYGLAGEYRLPTHGVEYRTLSNFWLMHPAVYHLVLNSARNAFRLGLAGRRSELVTVPEIAVVNAINNTDVKLARRLIKQESELFRAVIAMAWPNDIEATFAKILTPLTSWGIDPNKVLENWSPLMPWVQQWRQFVTKGPYVAPPTQPVSMSSLPGIAEPIRPAQPTRG